MGLEKLLGFDFEKEGKDKNNQKTLEEKSYGIYHAFRSKGNYVRFFLFKLGMDILKVPLIPYLRGEIRLPYMRIEKPEVQKNRITVNYIRDEDVGKPHKIILKREYKAAFSGNVGKHRIIVFDKPTSKRIKKELRKSYVIFMYNLLDHVLDAEELAKGKYYILRDLLGESKSIIDKEYIILVMPREKEGFFERIRNRFILKRNIEKHVLPYIP